MQSQRSWGILARWSSSQASASLTVASASWMLSGLTASPLINAFLPIFLGLPALLPLPFAIATGYGLQAIAVLLFLAVAFKLISGFGWVLLAIFLFGLAQQLSRHGLEEYLLRHYPISRQTLTTSREFGQISGNLLAGLLFPIGQAILQFLQALILLLPIATTVRQSHQQKVEKSRLAFRFCGRSLLQGLLFGALFALLPLWVRKVAAGTCLDFGLILTVYGSGRMLTVWIPRLPIAFLYIGLALLLGLLPMFPSDLAVVSFLPLGAIAAQSDFRLIDQLAGETEADRWQQFLRFGLLGGLIGSFLIGTVAQSLGLERSLPLLAIAFATTGVIFTVTAARSPHSKTR